MKPIRLLLRYELPKYLTHLLSLDANSRYRRFAGAVSDQSIVETVDRMKNSFSDYKIFVIEDDSFKIIAAAQLYTNDPVELSVSVLENHQKLGCGNELMKYVIRWCRNRNIGPINMVCLRSNGPIKKLAERHAAIITAESSDAEAVIEVGPPTVETVIAESVHNVVSFTDYFNKTVVNAPAVFTNTLWKK